VDCTCNKTADERPNLFYAIKNPTTEKEVWPSRQRVWLFDKKSYRKIEEEKRLWWGETGKNFPRLKRFLSDVQGGVVPSTWWDRTMAGDNQEARRELRSIFDQIEDAFDTPKPSRLIKTIVRLASRGNDNEVILDFFSGSCSTAQAVMALNTEDGGNRRFIMVQLPERTGKKDFPTIADIGKERIRRVIAKMKKGKAGELPLKAREAAEDLGFKVFKLVESNYRPWTGVKDKTADGYSKEMELFTNPLIDDWKPENLLWEVAVKEGLSLTSTVEKVKEAKGLNLYRIIDADKGQEILVSLDEKVRVNDVKALNLDKNKTFICRDSALDDETAANLALQCRLKTI
jgi:adenine-specific DNA-methyltransferase